MPNMLLYMVYQLRSFLGFPNEVAPRAMKEYVPPVDTALEVRQPLVLPVDLELGGNQSNWDSDDDLDFFG